MSTINLLLLGKDLVFTPSILLTSFLGTLAGVTIGALPGLTATMGVAIIIPFTFGMSFQHAFALILGTYCGGVFGGSMTAVIANIPGTPSAMMTRLDGYPMGQRGEGGKAIFYATIASFLGGIISVVILIIFAPPIAKIALQFSAQEYFAVAFFGLSIIAYISPGSMLKGFISGFLGLLLASVGMDAINAYPRYTFGNAEIMSGFELLPILIGIFGVSNVFEVIEKKIGTKIKLGKKVQSILISWKDFLRVLPIILRQAPIGTIIGAIPAAGGTIAAIVAYGFEKRISPHPEKFGTGIPEGIVAPETANNASTGGALIPLLTLGIPGDAIGAILIGGLMIHGLVPGPMLFVDHPEIVSSIFLLMIMSNVFFFFIAFGMAKIINNILKLPYSVLMPIILVLCTIGSFAIRNSIFDIFLLLTFGILGYILGKLDIPCAPLVLGFILGPIMESNLRRGLLLSGGNIFTFFTRPISAAFLILTIILLLFPLIMSKARHRKKGEE